MKTDLRKINFNKSATWNMWKQLDIDLDTLKNELDVTTYFFPEEEQQKVVDYLLKNYKKLKFYKNKPKWRIKKYISAEWLAYFPRGN